jgi:competence protein ComEC
MSKKWLLLWVIIVFTIPLVYLWYTKDTIRVIVCNVGQGDGIILIHRSKQIVVDAGNGGKMLACLARFMPLGDHIIEQLVVTHADADHIGGIPDVLNMYKIEQIVSNSIVASFAEMNPSQWPSTITKTEKKMFEAMQDEVHLDGAVIKTAAAGNEEEVGGMHLRYIWPRGGVSDTYSDGSGISNNMIDKSIKYKKKAQTSGIDDNSMSVVFELKFGGFTALFSGDLETPEEEEIMRETAENTKNRQFSKNLTVLKVAHHGSKSGTGESFVLHTKPWIAVVSVGEKNRYGHPSNVVMDRLTAHGARLFRTDRDGTVCIETNGTSVWRVLPFAQREVVIP